MSRAFRDVYGEVTTEILGYLERGVRPWAPQWKVQSRLPLRATGEPYRGINVVLLWMAASRAGYRAPTWFTFNQAKAFGASVRKGEKATRVVYFEMLVKTDTREGREGEETTIPLARTYAVFNAEQIDGLPERFGSAATNMPLSTDAPGMDFFAAVGADVRHGGDRAFYMPQRDQIAMPELAAFASADAYSATLAHELVHWTGHATRLSRDLCGPGKEARAVEELIAELGAAFTCATLGIAAGEREDHAAYISEYLAVLRSDPRAFMRAASAAQKAADFLHQSVAARATDAA